MREEKKKMILDALINSTKVEVLGKGRFGETRTLFPDLVPAIKEMKRLHPTAGAKALADRVNKVMNENGYPKFKLSAQSIVRWYHDETGQHLTDKEARERGQKLRAIQEAKKAKEVANDDSQIMPDEPPVQEPETPAQIQEEPIGLDQVAGMPEDEFIVNDDVEEQTPVGPEGLATPPDPFGDV